MVVEQGDHGSLRVLHDGRLIAEASSSSGVSADLSSPVSLAGAGKATGRARYFEDPLFPDCFVCGMNRQLT
jgi:hypothetical protein